MTTVLVADDKRSEVCDLIERLEKTGYTVIYVPDGRQALQLIRAGRIDAAILDWRMPPRNAKYFESHRYYGDEVAKTLRKEGHDLPLIIRSSVVTCIKDPPEDTALFDKVSNVDKKILDYLEDCFA